MQSAPWAAGSTAWIECRPSSSAITSSPGRTSRSKRRADEVERAGLGRDDRVVAEPAEHERPEAVRVAEGEELAVGEPDDGRRALEPPHRRRDGFLERPLVVGDQRRDHLRVGGRGERLADRSRSASAFTRLPLWPSATVRTRPWWRSGCAFSQAFPPVVE